MADWTDTGSGGPPRVHVVMLSSAHQLLPVLSCPVLSCLLLGKSTSRVSSLPERRPLEAHAATTLWNYDYDHYYHEDSIQTSVFAVSRFRNLHKLILKGL